MTSPGYKKLHLVYRGDGAPPGARGLGLAAILFWVIAPPAWAADTCNPVIARVVSVQGTVEIRRANRSDWAPAANGSALCPQDIVRVGDRARAAVRLVNQTVVRLDQRTSFVLGDLDDAGPSLLDLLLGRLHIITRTPKPYRINTPYVNANVEGTEFFVEVTDQRATLGVFEGRVSARNESGTVTVADGEVVATGLKPGLGKDLTIKPRDAVQWALYYPAVIDFALSAETADMPDRTGAASLRAAAELYRRGKISNAVDALREDPAYSSDYRFPTIRAAFMLAVGRIDEALPEIDRAQALKPNSGDVFALRSIIAVVRNEPSAALDFSTQALTLEPHSASAGIARSYALQANFDIDGALRSVQQVVRDHPDNALALGRLAEMSLAVGNVSEAVRAAREAVRLDDRIEKSWTVLGFASLAKIDAAGARAAFTTAISLDQAAPLARLGLGLAKLRAGDLAGGREEVELAVSLDPQNALLRSYLAKAYSAENRGKLVDTQLRLAKAWDTLDPTPWLYGAIRLQGGNRPVEALSEWEKSIELNDRRGVFRSRLLLDQDLASRQAGLAGIYDDLGFYDLGVSAATQALSVDPANFSAHRLLSELYPNYTRREIARVSELLQAQLLQPQNLTPVQPHLSVADLPMMGSAWKPEVDVTDPYLGYEHDGLRLLTSLSAGNDASRSDEFVVSGIADRASFSMGQYHSETQGFRQNDFVSNDLADGLIQFAISPVVNVQAELRHRRTSHGDIALNFAAPPNPRNQEHLDEGNGRVGLHLAPRPDTDILLSVVGGDIRDALDTFATPTREILTTVVERGQQSEMELIQRFDSASVRIGGDVYRTDVDTTRTRPGRSPLPGSIYERKQGNAYVYADLKLEPSLVATMGVARESYRALPFHVDGTDPKFGLIWSPTESMRVRLGTFRTVKRALLMDQTIEPTQVAGFNQLYDDLNGTAARQSGLATDIRISKRISVTLEATRRRLSVPVTSTNFDSQRESDYRVAIDWVISDHWVANAGVQYERFSRITPPAIAPLPGPLQTRTNSAPLSLRYFGVGGMFLEGRITAIRQNIVPPAGAAPGPTASDFAIADFGAGYKLPQRLGVISLEARNLFNRHFLYQDDNFRTSQTWYPQFVPSRTWDLRYTGTF